MLTWQKSVSVLHPNVFTIFFSTIRKMCKSYIWDPLNILYNQNGTKSNSQYAIVILNTKINYKPEFLLPLWTNASLRFTVDGGTNRWYRWCDKNVKNLPQIPNPDYVSGDMDSIEPNIFAIVKSNPKISILYTSDQNETDFTKALKEFNKICISTDKKINNVVAVVDTAGRLDQIMANINTLHKALSICPDSNVYQLANSSLSWLLCKGKHKIYIPDILRKNQIWCALIPVGEPCTDVSTSGLKWDLKNNTLKFGELVSSSNTYSDQFNEPYVTIETDKTLLWSMGLTGIPL